MRFNDAKYLWQYKQHGTTLQSGISPGSINRNNRSLNVPGVLGTFEEM